MADQELQEREETDEQASPAAPPPPDPAVMARRREALRRVRQWGDPVLKTRALEVTRFDDALRTQAATMGDLMDDALGVGLAAPQVGLLQRMFVYRVVSDGPLNVLVNPVIEWSSKEEEWLEEGCLSLPAVHVDVERPVHIRVSAQDEWGEHITIEASGLEARIIQHERDHLDGTLILDRTPRGQRKDAMRALREAMANDEHPQ
jgi:peptide deformylase